MNYYVLPIGDDAPTHALFQCGQEQVVATGEEHEMFWVKDGLEREGELIAAAKHRQILKDNYLALITRSGRSLEQANQFLKSKMPTLYDI